MTEQYTRPNTRVNTTSRATMLRFRASRAGRNWIFAIQSNHRWMLPVKSRKSSVMQAKNRMASISLILRNINRMKLVHDYRLQR